MNALALRARRRTSASALSREFFVALGEGNVEALTRLAHPSFRWFEAQNETQLANLVSFTEQHTLRLAACRDLEPTSLAFLPEGQLGAALDVNLGDQHDLALADLQVDEETVTVAVVSRSNQVERVVDPSRLVELIRQHDRR